MAKFIKRITAPSTTDKNWINIKKNGYNHAMMINSSTGSVLANCTGYVHGRWLELGLPESKLCLYNANQYFNYTRDGFARGQVPKLGAILCWSKSGKAGHVAVVEAIYSDGTVLASQSNYRGTRFYTKRFDPHRWPSGYNFQGYIYSPIDFQEDKYVGNPVGRDPYIHQVQVTYDQLRARANPYLTATIKGYIMKGYYSVLDEKDMRNEPSNGYYWYKVGDDLWIAAVDNEKVIDLPKVDDKHDYSANLRIGYASSGDLKRIEALLNELDIPYYSPQEGYVITEVAPSKGDRNQIESLCAELGIDCVEYGSSDNADLKVLQEKYNKLLTENKQLIINNTALKEKVAIMEEEITSLDSRNKILENQNATYSNAIIDIKAIVNKF